ncbi:MAG: MFS transporter [Faecalibacterium sp.]
MQENTRKFQVTPLERSWILYDVGNSAFVLMVSTLIPIFFNALAEGGGLSSVEYLAYWGYATSIVTVVTAILSPILGSLADTKGYKKPIFILCLVVGVTGCCAMGFVRSWFLFLAIFVIAKIGYSGSLVFYDAMLNDVTTPERVDMVSSRGYAWGYIGSCVPFVVCLALVLGSGAIGLDQMTALSIALVITAAWWLLVTLPLLRSYKQTHYVEVQKHAIRQSFVRIGQTLRTLPQDRQVFWFLLAFFCYIDGVYTIIDMATAYGTALGLDTTGLLLALLVTQIVAFPSALVFGRLSAKYPARKLIPVCISAYVGIAVFAFFLKYQWQFWVLAVVVGMFQGGVQALSRSHFAKIIPPEKSGEYFGLFDICGKGASFLGTMIVSVGTQLTGSANVGVGSIAVLFVIGQILFNKSCRMEKTSSAEK